VRGLKEEVNCGSVEGKERLKEERNKDGRNKMDVRKVKSE
jgi:hypothetical protein